MTIRFINLKRGIAQCLSEGCTCSKCPYSKYHDCGTHMMMEFMAAITEAEKVYEQRNKLVAMCRKLQSRIAELENKEELT